jgi:hypothetical protein
VALAGTVAAVAGHRAGITTDEGDGHQRTEHCNRETEETLHLNPPDENPDATCVSEAVTNGTPIRDGYRTAADNQPVCGTFQAGNQLPTVTVRQKFRPRKTRRVG